jgi:hypothetical protein
MYITCIILLFIWYQHRTRAKPERVASYNNMGDIVDAIGVSQVSQLAFLLFH